MSEQHPSKSASAQCVLSRGCAVGRGTTAASAFVPLGMGGWEAGKVFSILRGWRLNCVSAMGKAEWGFSCGFCLLFFFPCCIFSVGKCCLVEIPVASLESGCLSVCEGGCRARAVLSILRGCGMRGVAGAWRQMPLAEAMSQVLSGLPWGGSGGGFDFPSLLGCGGPGSHRSPGLWSPSRNTWRIHSTYPTGPNPARSCAGLHRACVPSIPPTAGTTLGLVSRAVGTPALLGSWVWSLFLPNPRGEVPVLAAKPLGLGLGRAPPPLRGCRVGDAGSPPLLPRECLAGGYWGCLEVMSIRPSPPYRFGVSPGEIGHGIRPL